MKKQTKQKFIYLRYILPPIIILASFAMIFIPSYRFAVEGKVDAPISAFSLFKNSFELSRSVLFGAEEQTMGNIIFSRILFCWIIISIVLCVISIAVFIWCAVAAVRYFSDDNEERAEKTRILFITFLPNRVAVSFAQALVIPFFAFPYIMAPVYKILGTRVILTLCAPEPFIVVLIILLATFVLSTISSRFERELGVDFFEKISKDKDEDEASIVDNDCDGRITTYGDELERKARNERIRKLLNKDKEDIDKDD